MVKIGKKELGAKGHASIGAITIGTIDVVLMLFGVFNSEYGFFAVASAGIITFIGTLMLVNYLSKSDELDKGEMRKALASSLIVGYFLLFFMLKLIDDNISNAELAGTIIEHYTSIVEIVIVFYFGSRTVEEYLKLKYNKQSEDTVKKAIENLKEYVEGLKIVDDKSEKDLIAKLDNVVTKLNNKGDEEGINELNNFISAVEQEKKDGNLTEKQATDIINKVKVIKDTIIEIITKTIEVAPRWMIFKQQEKQEYIKSTEIKKIIRAQDNIASTLEFEFSDNNYQKVDINHLKKWLAIEPTDKTKYKENDHDCDDFAVSVHGHLNDWDSSLATMIAFVRTSSGGKHAMCGVIGTDDKLYLIEPQTDVLYSEGKGYTLYHVFII